MKKIFTTLIILVSILSIPVKAANYTLKEFIPINTETTIVTDNFSYKHFKYSQAENIITFEGIKNLKEESKPISISIALFNDKKKNIGIINYCNKEDSLSPNEERYYKIEVSKDFLGEEFTQEDIKYIVILSDNNNCRVTGSTEFIGKKLDDIISRKNSVLSGSDTEFTLNLFKIIIVVLIALFAYNFLFTNAYTNFNGDDIRDAYDFENKRLKAERSKKKVYIDKNIHPDEKSEEIKQQELNESKKANKEDSDLHNFYK